MGRIKGEGRIITSVTISPEFFSLAKELNISFTEALRIGLSIMFAEKDVNRSYDNNINVVRKMNIFQMELEKTKRDFDEYRSKHEPHAERVEIIEKKLESYEQKEE